MLLNLLILLPLLLTTTNALLLPFLLLLLLLLHAVLVTLLLLKLHYYNYCTIATTVLLLFFMLPPSFPMIVLSCKGFDCPELLLITSSTCNQVQDEAEVQKEGREVELGSEGEREKGGGDLSIHLSVMHLCVCHCCCR